MPNVKDMDIDVEITRDAAGNIQFALNENNGNGPVQQIDFFNSKRPGIMVYFKIDDQVNSRLVFQPVPSDALWVQPPGGPWVAPGACPAKASAWDQFVPLSVEENGKQLFAYFRNQNPGVQFNFALRFLWPDGREENYDPIGNGNNGPRS